MPFTYYSPKGYKLSDENLDFETTHARDIVAAAYGWRKLDGTINKCDAGLKKGSQEHNEFYRERMYLVPQEFHLHGCAGIVPDDDPASTAAFQLTMMYADRLLGRDMQIPINQSKSSGRNMTLYSHVVETDRKETEWVTEKPSVKNLQYFYLRHKYEERYNDRGVRYTVPIRYAQLNDEVDSHLRKVYEAVHEGVVKHRQFVAEVGKASPVVTRILIGAKVPFAGNLVKQTSYYGGDLRSFTSFQLVTAPESGDTLDDIWNMHDLGNADQMSVVDHWDLKEMKKQIRVTSTWGKECEDIHKPPAGKCTDPENGGEQCRHVHGSEAWERYRATVRENYSSGWLTYPDQPKWRPVSSLRLGEFSRFAQTGVINMWKLLHGKVEGGQTTFRIGSAADQQRRRNSNPKYFRTQVQTTVPVCYYCGKKHKKTDAIKCAKKPLGMFKDGGVFSELAL